jgi:hypothetical protein
VGELVAFDHPAQDCAKAGNLVTQASALRNLCLSGFFQRAQLVGSLDKGSEVDPVNVSDSTLPVPRDIPSAAVHAAVSGNAHSDQRLDAIVDGSGCRCATFCQAGYIGRTYRFGRIFRDAIYEVMSGV